jgi:hypothetical protein
MSDTVIHPKMTATTREGAERIAELWPQLSEDVQLELIEIAEAAAEGEEDEVDFPLTAKEMASVEAARRDFAEGRTMTLEELEQSLDRFFADRK